VLMYKCCYWWGLKQMYMQKINRYVYLLPYAALPHTVRLASPMGVPFCASL
jgi:hypothetical protein